MCRKFVILLCCIGAALAYPYENAAEVLLAPRGEALQLVAQPYLEETPPQALATPLRRVRRQFNMSGGGSRGQGFDINANARVPVWTSNNGRHSFDATAGYSQHLGGPYGNSPADVRGGGIYTFRF